MGDQETYDDAFNESQTGDEFDRQVPANILDREYRKKLRPDPRLQFSERRKTADAKAREAMGEDDDELDEARDSQVEPAMEEDGILMGVDTSLRLAPLSELVSVQQKSKTNRYQRRIKAGIYTRNPQIIDDETGAALANPLIDVNGTLFAKTEDGFWTPSGGNNLATTGFDPENAVTSEFQWIDYGFGRYAIQFPLKAPRRGEINYLYLTLRAGMLTPPGKTNYIVYLLDQFLDFTMSVHGRLSVPYQPDRRHIIYQNGTTAVPLTVNELVDSIDPPARYINRDPDPKKEYRIWCRIESTGVMDVWQLYLGLNIKREG